MTETVTNNKELELVDEEFIFTTSDTFSPDFDSSSASLLWYKAGQKERL